MRSKPPAREVDFDDRHLGCLRQSHGLLDKHLTRLRSRPMHGNTRLRDDRLFLGLLLSFFQPMARSLRQIEGCGNFGGELDLSRLARSTTADALAVFDPECLKPLIEDLRLRCPGLEENDMNLAGITRRIIAADGTYLTTLADVAWALHHTKSNGRTQGQVRANLQLDVASWVPKVLSISGDDGQSEPAAFAHDLLSGVLYVVDRNFVEFSFLAALLARGNDLVLRIKSNQPAMRVIKSLPLKADDLEADVIADELVELTAGDAPSGTFRRVTIQTTNRNGQSEIIRLLTNLIDSSLVPARVVAKAYQLRWQIELFFKWLKCFARMDHLLSTSRQGITTQLYVAVIAVLLMHVQTGRRVSIYCLAALSRVASGQQTIDQAMEFLARRERERELERARQARLRQCKKLA